MPDRPEYSPLLLALVVLFSVLLHVFVLIALVALVPPTDEPLGKTYEVEAITVVEPDDDSPVEQVVSLDKPDEESEPPKDAKVADRYNQKADQETVRKRDPGLPGGMPVVVAPPKRVTPDTSEAKSAPDEDSKDAFKTIPDDDDDGLKARAESVPSLPDRDKGKTAPETDGSDRPNLDPAVVLPTMANSTIGTGGGASQDYLNIEEGEKDVLNRKETRYWAFFDRLKTAVGRQWNPNGVYRSHDPRGQVYGVQDRLTIIKVTLNGDGSVNEMFVEKPCGLDFMDNEAVRAFTAAQPYPNPPEALKDDRGLVSFRFGFMFEIQASGGRIIRYR
jgi:TonB family protein